MTTIPTRAAFDYLADTHGIPITVTHTGGGNYVAGIGAHLGYDEEQGTDVYDVNVGPLYRDAEGFTGEGGDLYLVSAYPAVPDVTVHVAAQLLPTLIHMLGIDDVTVDDATLSLDDIAAAMGPRWFLGCLGGNNYGVCDEYGTIITLDAGHVSFLPASVTVGHQGPDDDEWRQIWSGQVWDAVTVREIVRDRL